MDVISYRIKTRKKFSQNKKHEKTVIFRDFIFHPLAPGKNFSGYLRGLLCLEGFRL